MDLGLSGLASGLDWKTLISKLAEVDRAPQRTMLSEQTALEQKSQAFGAIKTSFLILRDRITALKSESLFDGRTSSSSDSSLGTSTASAGAVAGSFEFAVSQLATASKQKGVADTGLAISSTNDVSGVSLSSAGFATAVTAGTFTVNGKQVTVESTDSLGGLFTKISDATGGDVTASYDSATDKITLSSSSAIVLGSATDTSNFIQTAKLYSNNQGTISSDSALGAVRLGATLNSANFATAITGDSSGGFKINGVSIAYDSSADTVASVIARINASGAGVLANYDSASDRFTLTNKGSGNIGISLEDNVGSNFLQAAGLIGGTLEGGQNLLYTINGGSTLTSQSNTITSASSGLDGVSVTALAEDSFTVTVGNDTTAIKTAITSFVEAFNSAQSQLSTYTASSTDALGKVSAGTLSDDPTAAALAGQLRSLANSSIGGLDGSVSRLEALGISSNGYDDSLSTADLSNLDTALANNLTAVKDFFTNADLGWSVKFDSFMEKSIGDAGTLTEHQTSLSKLAAAITPQIDDQERWVQSQIERLTASFVAMESAQARSQQQLQYLTKTFG